MLTHTNLVVNALNGVAGIGFNADTTYIHSGPMFHLADGASTFGVTMAGAAMPSCRVSSRSKCCRPSRREGDARAVRADHDQHAGQPLRASASSTSRRCRFILYGASPMPEGVLRQALEVMPHVG